VTASVAGSERPSWWIHSPWAGALTTALYFSLGVLCIEVATVGERVALLWLPAGVGVAALLLGGWRLLPWIFLGALCTNLWANMSWVAVGVSFGNCAGALTGWRLLVWLHGQRAARVLESAQDVKWFALFGACVTPLVSGAIGATMISIVGEVSQAQWFSTLCSWVFGDGCGVLLAAPPLLSWSGQREVLRGRRWELWVLCASFALISLGLWWLITRSGSAIGQDGQGALLCVFFPLLVWAALRLGAWMASMTVLAVATLAMLGVLTLIEPPQRHRVMFEVWLYSSVMGLTSLLLTAMQRANEQAQAALDGSEAKLEQALEAAAVGLWVWDIPKDELLWSPQVTKLFDLPAGTYKGNLQSIRSLIHPDDIDDLQASIDASLKPGGPRYHVTHRVIARGGQVNWIEERGSVTFDDAGNPLVMSGTSINITARKEAEAASAADQETRLKLDKKLQEAQRLESLGVLAGGIAHDFNNLLTGIMGNASMIEVVGTEETRPFVDDLMTASRRAAELCKQMLAYSGRGRFEIKPVDLSALVSEMLQLLHTSTTGRATLHLNLSDDLSPVLADAAQLRQVVMNLVINAAESLRDHGGEIWLQTSEEMISQAQARSLSEEQSAGRLLYYEAKPQASAAALPPGRYVCFEVRDTGCGMDAQTQARIFDPFFTTKFHGRGLGLAAVLGIVRGHRGALQLTSEVGLGSTFRLLLPAALTEARCATIDAKRKRTDPLTRLTQGHALIIDDEASVRALTSEVLSRVGFVVHTAENGEEGIRCLTREGDQVTVVLLDLTMPGMSSREVLQAIRAEHPRCQVVIMSGFSAEDVHARLDAAPDAFLSKPFSAQDLLDALRSAAAIP
jgi:PAS domain S-box-containing protein